MAGIKIETANAGNPTGQVDRDGYVAFVDQLCVGNDAVFDEIADYDNDDLVKLLKDLETGNPPVRRITIDNGRILTKNRVKLTVVYDDKERTRRGKRKFNINLPTENPLANGGNLDYLNQYITILENQGTPLATRQKFLFGMLVLTKCR